MKNKYLIIGLILFSLTFSNAMDKQSSGTSLEELNTSTTNAVVEVDRVSNTNNWTEFRKSTTKKAFRAFGKPISVSGYETVTEDNIEALSLKFIEDNAEMLGVDKSQVVYHNSNYVMGKWYVHLKQEINGLSVVFSGIELKVNKNAQVFSYGVEYYETNNVDLTPRVGFNQAYEMETKLSPKDNQIMDNAKSGELYAFPMYENGSYRIEAAYRAEYKVDNKDYAVYISSINGQTLFRKKMTHELKTTVEVFTNIKEESALSPVVRVPADYQTINIKGKQYTTGLDGKLELDLNTDEQIVVNFEGPWAKFENQVFEQGKINTEIKAGENNVIEWNDSNSDIRERMVVHHLNKIRDYYKAFDTTKKAMDFQMELLFDKSTRFGTSPNAYSGGSVIGFVNINDKSARLSETPTVLYHEYGHSINKLLYQELGQQEGMVNGAANEGIADITAALMVDDSRVGYGAYTADPNQIIRNCKNNFKYPDDIIGESHHDSQILSGALWDLRELTDLETVRNIAHFARYGLPDDEENDVCFSEWLIEVLVADDDDGDLTNGTPNSKAIITAFDNHNIGFDLMLRKALIHDQKVDLVSTNNIISISSNILAESNFNKDSLEISLVYSYDDFKTQTEIPFSEATKVKNGYKFEFNKVIEYALITYHFNLKNVSTGKVLEKLSTKTGNSSFIYEYGYLELKKEDMLSDEWVFKRVGSALGAELEIGTPDVFDYSQIGLSVSQTSDSEDSDNISIVTGAKVNAQSFFNSVPFTALEGYSPIYKLEGYKYPVLKFKTWYSKQSLDPSADVDLLIYISSDGGSSWKEGFKLDDEEDAKGTWSQHYIVINQYVASTDNFKFAIRVNPNSRFTVSSGFPTCFSEFQIDDISIIDPEFVSSVESELADQYSVTVENDNINITLGEGTTLDNEISLFDIKGRKVISVSNINNQKTVAISRSNLVTGVYLLEINNGKQVITKKVLVD
ncbi:MAG: hypothetical protein CVV25_07500 [Ignavibacteriae bacterium HGW-Ignavibacteriae-4]|jgi:hypothetical protein|nr:MAG: hypothetical protein CVV25_07500 [Ignavibacteriae bacterium HGW-Ignavibacteriae-4]